MNPLLKKEICLLLPSWIAALSLVALLPWFWKDPDASFAWTPFLVFFGMIMLAVDSFGRECSLGTFQLLLSQPIERQQIWRAKITVLLLAAALIFAAYFASCELRLHLALTDSNSVWHVNPKIIRDDFRNAMFGGGVVMLVALAGGLWTTLLLRQVSVAFWTTFLAPAGLLILIILFLPSKLSDHVVIPLLYSAAGLYIIWGFWLAHRLFYRAQDAAWTGGIVSFAKWRYFEAGSDSSISTRHRKPFAALVKKEFQLQSISLICATALLALHIAVILMRKVHGNFGPHSLAGTVSEFYWSLWLVMPLIIGCTVVAEEQRLGVMEGQFCLPASRRLQFALKFFLTIVSGLLLGGFMPLLLEGIAAIIGAPNPDFRFLNRPDGFGYVSPITVVSYALGLSLAGIFASTLAKNFLQAMGIAVATIIGCCLFTFFAGNLHSFLGVSWNPRLTMGIAVLTTLVMISWLAYGNFKYFQDRGRMWRRNIWGLTGVILFIFISSAAVYNRAWEVFEPAEPAHGPAIFSQANPPVIHNAGYFTDDLLVQLPDGRVWYDRIGYRPIQSILREEIRRTINPFPTGIGPQRFVTGSNWVSYVIRHIDNWPDRGTHITGYLETVGIQSDGRLWISDKSDSPLWTEDRLTRFGDETNWQAVSWTPMELSVLLLKKDGTLWRWGAGTNQWDWHEPPAHWPALRDFNPYHVGTNSDWKKISFNNSYLQKADGSVWSVSINPKSGKDRIWRNTNWDQVDFEKIPKSLNLENGAYVHKDGTLWVSLHTSRKGSPKFETFQSGKETNWVSVASSGWIMGNVALKSDGTLWQLVYKPGARLTVPPTRLGIHNDWVAIAEVQNGAVSLAADGTLWLWPERYYYGYYRQTLLKLPKQPKFLGNVFGKAD